ncbi:MAG: polysaccharide biosynthesis/export family protein [Thermaurantiacus tibetensis]|uniref:polysaccharide biosynthesis/export family protein n=1 Tax=Thermaurantiacus tibetensis TaxID=2759035 RepID=UPI00188DD37C|nr:polysaccharide biosynthesis/export family protein [Thermaurantiacus tibetensis]
MPDLPVVFRPALRRLWPFAAAAFSACAVVPPAGAQTPAPAYQGYVLGPGDAIAVTVYGHDAFNVTTRIKPDGTISMPLVGQIPAAGRTVVTLAADISRRLTEARLLRDPIVNVEIGDYQSRTVRVVGQVSRPGIIPLDQPYTLLDVLLKAGWVRGDGSRNIIVRRAGVPDREISIDALLKGDPAADVPMEPGLTVVVPEPELVYVMGGVGRPGGYPLLEGMTVRRLIGMAGGATDGNPRRFRLERDGKLLRDATLDTPLKAGDVITLRQASF